MAQRRKFLGEKFTIFGGEVHNFWGEKFCGQIISQKLEIDWPPHSPLDYLSWSLAMIQVCCQKTSTIAELTAIVEDVAATAPKEMIQETVENIRKRCQVCQVAKGGQYEPSLKKI